VDSFCLFLCTYYAVMGCGEKKRMFLKLSSCMLYHSERTVNFVSINVEICVTENFD